VSRCQQNFWTLLCKGRLTEADKPTIQLGATPSGLNSAHLHHPPYFLQAGCPTCHPTNSVKALKASSKNQQSAVKMQLHFLSYTNTSNLSKVEVYSLNAYPIPWLSINK